MEGGLRDLQQRSGAPSLIQCISGTTRARVGPSSGAIGPQPLDYEGFESKNLGDVPLAHARWFASLAGQLTPAQLRAAFEAAGGTVQEVDGYSKRFLAKVAELQKAVK
jgi:hypothetical protein